VIERLAHARATCSTPPSKLTKMFSGVTSRWTIPSGCPCRLLGLGNDPAHVAAEEVFHGDEIAVADLTEIVDLDDVGMIELRGELRLVEEHPHEALLVAQVRADALQHHRLLEALHARLAGEEDLRHSADGDAIR
jgi:hypothetical protein